MSKSSQSFYERDRHQRRQRSRSKERYEKQPYKHKTEKNHKDADSSFERHKYSYTDSYSHHGYQRHKLEVGKKKDREEYDGQERDIFDFTKHKYSLNKIFFRNQDLIKRFEHIFSYKSYLNFSFIRWLPASQQCSIKPTNTPDYKNL